jgi:hypothetical protein
MFEHVPSQLRHLTPDQMAEILVCLDNSFFLAGDLMWHYLTQGGLAVTDDCKEWLAEQHGFATQLVIDNIRDDWPPETEEDLVTEDHWLDPPNESGQSMVEICILMLVVVMAVIILFCLLYAPNTIALYNRIIEALNNVLLG